MFYQVLYKVVVAEPEVVAVDAEEQVVTKGFLKALWGATARPDET